jgi:putative protease
MVGVVESLDKRSGSLGVKLTGSTVPEKGDGLVFRGPGREGETGMVLRREPTIGTGMLWMKPGSEVPPGARVFITRRKRLAGAVKCTGQSRIRVDLSLRISGDGRPVLEGSAYRDSIPVTVIRRKAGFPVEAARAREIAKEEVLEILSRSGDASYRIGKVDVDWPPGSYARKGDIGGLRRDLLAGVERYLIQTGRRDPGEMRESRERLRSALGTGSSPVFPGRSQGLVVLTDTLDGIEGIWEDGSGYLALEPARSIETQPEKPGYSSACEDAWKIIGEAVPAFDGTGWSLLWKWPRITGDPWIGCLSRIPGEQGVAGPSGLLVEGPGAALAAKSAFPGLPVHGGAGLNAWNARSVRMLSPLFHSLTLSPELSLRDLGELVPRARSSADPPLLGFPVEGNLEVMVSEDRLAGLLPQGRFRDRARPFIGIRDGTSRIFPVDEDICGRTEIFNSVETCLIDQLPALRSLGIDLLVIDARGRGPRYAPEMAAIYLQGLQIVENGGKRMIRELGDLREECRKRARGGITHGAFLSGLREEEE